MSVIDRFGRRVVLEVGRSKDKTTIDKTRDLTIIRLRTEGQTWRQIGAFLGLSHEGARLRWKAIPREVREHYQRKTSLG